MNADKYRGVQYRYLHKCVIDIALPCIEHSTPRFVQVLHAISSVARHVIYTLHNISYQTCQQQLAHNRTSNLRPIYRFKHAIYSFINLGMEQTRAEAAHSVFVAGGVCPRILAHGLIYVHAA